MLVRDDDLVIGQPAHAWVSGQLARAWGNAAFPAPAPREPVCLAAEQHDVGWQDADLAPLRGDGRAAALVPRPTRARSTSRSGAAPRGGCSRRAATPRCSCRCTAPSLYDRFVDPDAYPPDVAALIRAYLRDERALQAELAAGLDPAEVARNRRLIAGARPALARALPRPGDDARGRAGRRRRGRAPRRAGGRRAGRAAARDDHAVPPGTATAALHGRAVAVRRRARRRRLRGAAARGRVRGRRRGADGARGGAVGAAALGAQPRLMPSTSSSPPRERGSTPCSRS